MKILIFNLILLLIAFTSILLFSQNNKKLGETILTESRRDSIANEKHKSLTKSAKSHPDFISSDTSIHLDPVEKIDLSLEKNSDYINRRCEQLIHSTLKQWIESKGLKYPPDYILYRVFKKEMECEIWVGNGNKVKIRLIKTLRICDMDAVVGPKLEEDDAKTPEGFYTLTALYGSSSWFMWIKLDPNEIDKEGKVGYGSSFKLLVDYPNEVDKYRTRNHSQKNSPGSAIMMHGNCISVGCISFSNRLYLPIFVFSTMHNKSKYGNPQLHIFPYRFSDTLSIKTVASRYKDGASISESALISLWTNLKQGYDLLNKDSIAFSFKTNNGNYQFYR